MSSEQSEGTVAPVRWPNRFETDTAGFESPPAAFLVRKTVGGSFQVLFNERAFLRVRAHADEPPRGEALGLLAGEFCDDGHEQFVVVEGVVPAPRALALDDTGWQRLEAECRRQFPRLRLVGWYRCRGGSIRLSADEQQLHRSRFGLPFQVGLLYARESGDTAVFCWERRANDETIALSGRRGFYFYRPGPEFYALVPGAADGGGSETAGAERAARSLRPEVATSDGTTWLYLSRPFGRPAAPEAVLATDQAERTSRRQRDLEALRGYLGPRYEVTLEAETESFRVRITLSGEGPFSEQRHLAVTIPAGFPEVAPEVRSGQKVVTAHGWAGFRDKRCGEPMKLLAEYVQRSADWMIASGDPPAGGGDREARQ